MLALDYMQQVGCRCCCHDEENGAVLLGLLLNYGQHLQVGCCRGCWSAASLTAADVLPCLGID